MNNKMEKLFQASDEFALESINEIIKAIKNKFKNYEVEFWTKHGLYYKLENKNHTFNYQVLEPGINADEKAQILEEADFQDAESAIKFLNSVAKQFKNK